jgi:triosephosphate isomerase
LRKPLIAGNWKMNKTVAEGRALARAIREGLGDRPRDVEVVLCPPFGALLAVADAIRGSGLALGAQNMHWEKEGAFTGEISARMLAELGCRFVILGHSERRQLFGESDDAVERKTRAALEAGLVPIVCVGETLAEREAGRIFEVVERQVDGALRKLSPDQASGIVLAYEPVWAIGTGRTATPAQAQEVHLFVRRLLSRTHGEPVAAALRILYGGSVKPDNAGSLMAEPDLDGALVGGACLDAASFLKIVDFPRS